MTFESLEYVTRLGHNFYLVEGRYNGRFPYCNSFLFTGKQTVMIDTGIGEDRIKEIERIKRIDMVLFSHSHPDHIFNWHLLADRHLLYPKEMPVDVHDLAQLGERFTGSKENGIYWVEHIAKGLNLKPMREPNGRFGNNDCLDLGDVQLQAIHCPGHLKDHYCFFEKNSETLLTTDIDFSSFGPWFGNPESDLELFLADIGRVKAIPARQTSSSHKSVIVGDTSHHFNTFYNAYYRQRQKILSLCASPKTIVQLVAQSPMYNHKFPDRVIQDIFENNMILEHLKRMVKTELVQQVGDSEYQAI